MSNVTVNSTRAPEGMAGLVKGLTIIEAFGRDYARMTVADAARAAGCSRAAARRCLLSLFEQGYLTLDNRYFIPTPRMLRLGDSYLEAAPLPLVARPFIERARDLLQESVSVAVLDDDAALVIARAEADHIVPTGVRVGTRLPLHGSAVGRVLLSNLPGDTMEELLRGDMGQSHRRHKAMQPDDLRRALAEIIETGYAISDQELDIGLRALAVPIRESKNQKVIAALSVSSFSARSSRQSFIEGHLPVLREEADHIGRAM